MDGCYRKSIHSGSTERVEQPLPAKTKQTTGWRVKLIVAAKRVATSHESSSINYSGNECNYRGASYKRESNIEEPCAGKARLGG